MHAGDICMYYCILYTSYVYNIIYLLHYTCIHITRYAHIDIKEYDKKESNLGLGHRLIVQETDMLDEIYSDLDEIYARYIEPMNDLVTTIVAHPKFKMGSPEEVTQYLNNEIAVDPNRIPYCIRYEPNVPGKMHVYIHNIRVI